MKNRSVHTYFIPYKPIHHGKVQLTKATDNDNGYINELSWQASVERLSKFYQFQFFESNAIFIIIKKTILHKFKKDKQGLSMNDLGILFSGL